LQLSFSMNGETVKIELNALELAHATNVARMKSRILSEPGMSEKPLVTPARLRQLQAQFNGSEDAYVLYHKEEAYEGAAFLGDVEGANSDTVSFVIGARAVNGRIESARLIVFLQTASDVKAKKLHFLVRDESNFELANVSLIVPNAPSKRYIVPLDAKLLQRAVLLAKNELRTVLTLKLSAKVPGGHDLLVMKGRDGYEPHMAVAIEMQFASANLEAKRRRHKRAQPSKMGLLPNQCEKGQTDCCPNIQDFTWTELNISNIIAPLKFHSVVCRGHCTGFNHNDYKHTITRQAIAEFVREPCCHPIDFKEQHIIYVDENGNPVQRSIPNFYATRCVCD
ncbi:hypothetical protein PMAYCL1PPCAC_31948, partial [Pristionchus mayeri]